MDDDDIPTPGWWRTFADILGALTLFLLVGNFFTCMVGWPPAVLLALLALSAASSGAVLIGLLGMFMNPADRTACTRALIIGVPLALLSVPFALSYLVALLTDPFLM